VSAPVIKFTKMSAGGNDFIIIDNITAAEHEIVRPDAEFVRRVCARARSVGADGVILIEPANGPHAKMIHYNSDGGRSALCGNGVRCVARILAIKRLAPSDGMKIETDIGTLDAAVEADRPWFRLELGRLETRAMTLMLEGSLDEVSRTFEATLVNPGVPHLVIETRDAHGMSAREFLSISPRLRAHPDLGPEGANVNFITLRDEHSLDIRCYERGVEGETLSSGSGCISAVLVASASGRAVSPVSCRSRAGFVNIVTVERGDDGAITAQLSGDARVVYTGVLNAEALAGFSL
jgi:diaminopimelate epimerase